MTAGKQPFWEDAYRTGDSANTYFGGKPSSGVVKLAPVLPRDAAILDLGCGDGRNALYLAQQGFPVWGVDISAAAIEKLNRVANARGLSIHTEVCDMRDYRFPRPFDLIVCSGCLHLISRDDWENVLANIQANTSAGGYNLITVFTDVVPPPDDLREFAIGLFHEGELFTHYVRWTTVNRESRVFEDEHPGSPKHIHAANWVTARKP